MKPEYNTRTSFCRNKIKAGAVYPEFSNLTKTQRLDLVAEYRASTCETLAEFLFAIWVDKWAKERVDGRSS